MTRAKWRTVTPEDIGELRREADVVITASFHAMYARAAALGDMSSAAMQYAQNKEAVVREDVERFLNTLSTATDKTPNWASAYLSESMSVNIWSDTINSGEQALRKVRERYTSMCDTYTREFEAMIADGVFRSFGGEETFVLNQWAASNAILSAEFEVQSYLNAAPLVGTDPHLGSDAIQQSVIVPALEDVKDWIINQMGKVFTPTQYGSGYETFLHSLESFIHGPNRSYDSGIIAMTLARVQEIATGTSSENPLYSTDGYTIQDYYNIRDIVESSEKVYLPEDAITLYTMGISPETAWDLVGEMDHLNAVITQWDSTHPNNRKRGEFEATYRALLDYARATGSSVPSWMGAPQYEPRIDYETYLKEPLENLFSEEWDKVLSVGVYGNGRPLSGPALREAALEKGLDAELNVELGNRRQDISRLIASIEEDRWRGPIMPDPNTGIYIPLDGFREAEELYAFWMRGQIYSAFDEIEKWLETAEEDSSLSFEWTRQLAEMELTKRYKAFDMARPMGYQTVRSVMYEQWEQFAGLIYGFIGDRTHTQEEILSTLDVEQAFYISTGNTKAKELLASAASEMPPVFEEAAHIVDAGLLDRMSDYELDQYYRKLMDQRYMVPSDLVSKVSYEQIIAAYRNMLEQYRGGIAGMVTEEDAYAFVARTEARLKEGTFANWIALGTTLGFPQGVVVLIEAEMWDSLFPQIQQKDATSRLQDVGSERITLMRQSEANLRSREESYVDGIRKKIQEMIASLPTWNSGMGMDLVNQARIYAEIAYPGLASDVESLREALETAGQRGPVVEDWEEQAARVIADMKTAKNAGYAVPAITRDHAVQLIEQANGRYDDLVRQLQELLDEVQVLGSGMVPFVHFAPLKSREDATTTSVEELIDFAKDMLRAGIFIEPKINGQRAVLQVRNGDTRIFLEGDTDDWADAFFEICQEASVLNNVILDGEIVDKISDRVAPDIGTGEFTRSEVDNGIPIFMVFDILHHSGEDMADYPYEQRRRKLGELFAGKDGISLQLLPAWLVNTEDGIREKVQEALAMGGSEGALAKGAQGKYALNQTAPDWMKWRRTEEVDATVLKREKDENENYHYECGVDYSGEPGIAPDAIVEKKGKKYVLIGKTFGTRVQAVPGDVIRVRVSKINRIPGGKGETVEWVDPTVVSRVEGEGDSVGAALDISRVLSASISKPYSVLQELNLGIDEVKTQAELFALDKKLFEIYQELSFPRLRRMAWALIQKLQSRVLSQVGGVPLESRADIQFVTQTVVKRAEDDWKTIEGSRTESPEAALLAAKLHMDLVSGYISLSEDRALTDRLRLLRGRIKEYIDSVGGASGLDRVVIQTDLLKLRQRAYDAMDMDPSDPERNKEAIRIRSELNALQSRLGVIVKDYADDFKTIFDYLDRIPDPSEEEGRYTNANVQERLDDWQETFIRLDSSLNVDNEAMINSALVEINAVLSVLFDFKEGNDLTEYQKEFFGDRLQWLINRFRDLYSQWSAFKRQTLGGADAGDPSRDPRSITVALDTIVADRMKQQGELDGVLFERMSRYDLGVVDYRRLREQELRAVVEERGAELEELFRIAPSVGEAMRDMARALEFDFGQVDRRVTARYKEMYSFRDPQPLGPIANEEVFWASPGDEARMQGFEYGISLLSQGYTLLVRGEPGHYRVISIVDKDGNVVAGESASITDLRIQRMAAGVKQEAMADPLAQIMVGEDQSGLNRFLGGLATAVQGAVEINGKGNGYYAGDINGRAAFITNAHLVVGNSAQVRLPSGRVIETTVRWRGVDERVQQGVDDLSGDGTASRGQSAIRAERGIGDLVVLEAVEPGSIDMQPLALGTYQATETSRVYGTAVSPLLGEAELLKLKESRALAPFNAANDIERTRGGFSGSPVVDEYGNVVGLWSAGAPTSWSDPRGGLWVDSYGAVIPLDKLQEAYFYSGLTRLGGAILGQRWNRGGVRKEIDRVLVSIGGAWANEKSDYSVERLVKSVPPPVRDWAKKKAEREKRPVTKEDLKLRYKDPSGEENIDGVLAALRRLPQTNLPVGVKAKTKAFLQRVLKRLGGGATGAATPGAPTLDDDSLFMSKQPTSLPVTGKVYRSTDGSNIKYTLQFDWGEEPNAFTLLLGGVEDKWVQYRGGKLNTIINEGVANDAEEVDIVHLLPSRMRGSKMGDRYYEFYLTFDQDSEKNGLWGISENAARNYPAPFFFFRLEDDQPFWLRDGHDDEKRMMPRWQKPTRGEIVAFARGGQ